MSTEKRNGNAPATAPWPQSDNDDGKTYGGMHTGTWVDALPAAWVPYIQLCRLSPPAPVFLIFLPHLYGAVHGAVARRATGMELLGVTAWLLLGSLFFSNAAHCWNDLVDAPVDRLVPRTRKRPIARGAITRRAALIFMASQAAAAALCLAPLPAVAAAYAAPTVVGTAYYPFAKRQTPFPQLVLGFCLAWGIAVGSSAMGVDPLPLRLVPAALQQQGHLGTSSSVGGLCLIVACACWTVIYDTVYACLDVEEDKRLGLGSTAVLFGRHVKLVLALLLAVMLACLGGFGHLFAAGAPYYAVALGGSALSLGAMLVFVDLASGPSIWWWFTYGFWFTGGSMAVGLFYIYATM
ncbi:hypothetical protein PG999_010518 [Apiospora kogelbergensis]|uniref:Diterpenoid pyrone biosynthesis cluster protein C n=1 Tax=Apiospora kogelbergensis TaxID=1337665 RepID=A0AAW0QLI1_9PEZI